VNTFKQLALASACLMALAGTDTALAQSTDGYHTIQVFPVVVDTAAFTQRFTFRNPDADTTITIAPQYFPGEGTTQATALACPSFTVAAGSSKTFASLRDICPALATGSQFGYLYTNETSTSNQPFAAFSRVSNPAGQGFSVEAFPAHTFTSALQSVSGIRRLAASGGAPAFQTNCFIGNLQDVTPPDTPTTTHVTYTITGADGGTIGSGALDLTTGKIARLLDVFAAAGAPAGNYDGAKVSFVATNPLDDPGLMAFCTVQDNSSFGADFRISKQEKGGSTEFGSWAAQDDHVNRHTTLRREMQMPGETEAKVFSIPANTMSSNTHVFYFRHPDQVGCEIADPVTHDPVPSDFGLEMRLIGPDGSTVLAGGNGIMTFEDLFLGDKTEKNSGANGRYTLEVETDASSASARQYALHCHSGSGHSLGDVIRTGGPDRF
jgi:hypothetical protein